MTIEEFRRSIASADPPTDSEPLRALWHDARGEWNRAHEVAQNIGGRDGAWIHAYLHRKEGDVENARYWYSQAGKEPATGSFDVEWEQIAAAQLEP